MELQKKAELLLRSKVFKTRLHKKRPMYVALFSNKTTHAYIAILWYEEGRWLLGGEDVTEMVESGEYRKKLMPLARLWWK